MATRLPLALLSVLVPAASIGTPAHAGGNVWTVIEFFDAPFFVV